MNTVVTSQLESPGIGTGSVDVAALRALHSDGYVHLDQLWSPSFAEALTDEARTRFSAAAPPTGGPRTPVEPSRKPRMQTLVATGPRLSSLHFALAGLARALSGRMLVPTFAAYGYYQVDDHVLLHLDSEECELTLLTAPLGSVGPLHVHPDLRGMTLDELGNLENDPAWDRHSGIQVEYPRLGVTALQGRLLPHHRPGRLLTGLAAVTALCYRPLF